MANPQTSSSTAKRRANAPPKRGGNTRVANKTTDERDDTYGLISVIYHALQGAETTSQYIEDARAADNEELVAFFEECRGRQNELAMKGKRLLGAQLYETVGEDDDDDDDDDE